MREYLAKPRRFLNPLIGSMLCCGALASPGLAAETEEVARDVSAADTEEDVKATETDPVAEPVTLPEAPPPPKPVSARLVWSQFADVPVSGDADSTLRYGGKVDAYADVNGGAVGLDPSLSLNLHPEFRYGASSNGEIGLIPANTQLFYPGAGVGADEVFDLSVNVTKRWKSGTSLTVGKINLLDYSALFPIQGSGGHEGFQNLAVALPPSGIVPASVTGALLSVPTKDVIWLVMVFDPELQSRRSGLEDPFSKGVGLLASATFPTAIGGKPGFYSVKIAASTRSELATEALPPVLVPAPGSPFGSSKGEFAAILAFEQFLSVDPAVPGNGIGLFGQVFVSNGDPTFLDASGFIGIAGNPRGRPQDRFGAYYFRYSLTDKFVDVLAGRLPLEDEQGVEAFYTLGLSERLRLTANVQVVDSAIGIRDTGVTAGLRLTTNF